MNKPSFMALISVHPQSSTPIAEERNSKSLTESDMSRMIPAHGKISHHGPQVINSDISPNPFRFARLVQTPNLLHLRTEFFPENFLVFTPGITNSGGEDDEVCIQRAIVCEFQPSLGEFLDGRIVFESDLSVNDQLTSSVVCGKDKGQIFNNLVEGGG